MERIGGYEVLDELGRGGMGVVYRARDPMSGSPVALKLLVALSDPEERARFAREVETTRALDHPHVLAVLDLGQDRGRPFLITELAEGGSLEERLRQQPLGPAEAARVVAEVARGLAAAHRAGALHRDLKPANVLFASDGRALLADFGLARRLRDETLTATGTVLGTPGYMSPEQARGERADERSDVYGLGALLFAALSGGPPFRRGSLLETLAAVVSDPPPSPGAEVPVSLRAICLRCLSKDPAERYPSAAALGEALEGWSPGARRAGRPAALAGALALSALGLGLGLGLRPGAGPGLGRASPTQAPDAAPRLSPSAATPRPSSGPASPHAATLARVTKHLEARETELARALLEPVLASAPRDPVVLRAGARLALVERDYLRAKALGTRALELEPRDALGLTTLANALASLGERGRAIELLEQALQIAPRDAEVLVSRGFAHLGQGELQAALDLGRRACAESETLAMPRVLCSQACQRLGDLEQAATWAARAIELDPESAEGYYRRGALLDAQDRGAEAVLDYEQALALDPQHLPALLCAARGRAEAGQGARGRAHLERLLAQLEENRETRRGRMPTSAELLNWFRILRKTFPEHLGTRYEFGVALYEAGQFRASRDAFAGLWKGNGEQHYRQSALYWAKAEVKLAGARPSEAQERLGEAARLAEAALQAAPDDPIALHLRGVALLHTKSPAAGYPYLWRAYQLDPQPQLALDLANACARLRKFTQAEALLEQLAERPAYRLRAELLLAFTYHEQGQPQRAEALARSVEERAEGRLKERARALVERFASRRRPAPARR